MTLEELERWLAHAISGMSTTVQSIVCWARRPLAAWERGIVGDGNDLRARRARIGARSAATADRLPSD